MQPIAVLARRFGALGAKDKARWIAGVGAVLGIFTGLVLYIGPVLGGILMIMLLIAVTWLVPAFGLATLLPHLEPGARVPKWRGAIAPAAATVLALWAAWRRWGILFGNESETLSPTILVATSFTLALTSIFILRERPIRDLWPLAAVTVAFCLLGGAVGVQQATFYGIGRKVAGVTAPPAPETVQKHSPLEMPNAHFPTFTRAGQRTSAMSRRARHKQERKFARRPIWSSRSSVCSAFG